MADGTFTYAQVSDAAFVEQQIAAGIIVIKPDMSSVKDQALFMVYVGVFAFLMASSMNVFTALFSENIAFKTKIRYFTTCLEKDAAFYDENVPTTMASRISKECSAI